MNADEARRDALVRFGNRTAAKERVTGMDSALMLDKIWADIRFALRQLRKNPGFAFTAIVVLTLGIGASVAIFAFVDAALIKPLPYKDPTRLVSVYETVPSCPLCNISYQNYLDWRRSDLPFSSLQAWTWESFLINTPSGNGAGAGRAGERWVLSIAGRDTDSGARFLRARRCAGRAAHGSAAVRSMAGAIRRKPRRGGTNHHDEQYFVHHYWRAA
jgi:hypothetical protein